MPDPNDEHRAEAERLAELPRDVQRQIVALHRAVADNRKLPKRDRDAARERADSLERLLRLKRKK
jgi:hypothetical protein